MRRVHSEQRTRVVGRAAGGPVRRLLALMALLVVQTAALAQAPPPVKVVRIGALTLGVPRAAPAVQAFLHALRARGYVEGENLAFEIRYAEGQVDRLPALAAELAQQRVDVIVTESNAAALAAKQATQTIPIVMAVAGDPVKAGIVASLVQPGGNVTGLTLIHPELSAKRIQLLKEAAPRMARVAVLWNPVNPASADIVRETEVAARALGLQAQSFEARSPAELDHALRAAGAARVDALLTVGDGMLWSQRGRIVDFAIRQRLPTMFPDREFAESGGLMAYGPNAADAIQRAAALVDRVLKGAKPADLPIEQPMQMDLLINLKTAQALGLALPMSLRVRADRLIE